jgi:hypothetical protein
MALLALDVAFRLGFVEPREEFFILRARLLDRIEKNPAELLDVMLLVLLRCLPLETLNKLPRLGSPKLLGQSLHPRKQHLQLQWNAVLLGWVGLLEILPFKERFTELRGHEERLQQAVHVASVSQVLQTHVVTLVLKELIL